MAPRDTATACHTGCTSRGRHLDDCPDPDQCPGCLPRLAEAGSAVCQACGQRAAAALAELPQLWVDLAERPSTAGIATYGGTIGDPEACPDCDAGRPCDRAHRDTPAPLAETAITARSAIRAHLVTWCHVLADTRHITLPDEAAIARTTRDLAHHESTQAAAHRLGADIYSQPGWDAGLRRERPPDLLAAARHRREAHQHAARAAQHRQERETGLDVTRALADHVQRHLGPLLADPDTAPVIVDDLTTALRDARRVANRSRSRVIRITCTCGARVAIPSDTVPGEEPWIECSCGEAGVLSWWVGQTPAAKPMTLMDLTDWLLTTHGTDVPFETLRTWAARKRIEPVGMDGRRQLFDGPAVYAVALQHKPRRRTA